VFVLVHSPLTGPTTWAPVARALERRGVDVVVPSLLGDDGSPPRHWREAVERVATAVSPFARPAVLVGHSGAGLLLPAVASALGAPVRALVFVDSGLPAAHGETPLATPEMLDRLRARAHGGVLPPWSSWWGEDAMRELVPDDRLRIALTEEMPSLPLAYFEDSAPSTGGWDSVLCAYLQLSYAYAGAAAEARERGWRVEGIAGAQHLHIAVAPEIVGDTLVHLAGER
jgi:pimeloyl-ACP methyl ester carboxylesterase